MPPFITSHPPASLNNFLSWIIYGVRCKKKEEEEEEEEEEGSHKITTKATATAKLPNGIINGP